ncbi:uncharacterized protein DEA37_0007499 [Paragonimus westermani]|uniref:DUF4806 domain-containing protein n=1 Tax=Paragonimus westermani TaxID=34504 RepID=A0A5J4NS71_9TREM|nr:uncharacterized protein DEA37_0007499 [Paragonimus westermani]
MAAWPTMKQSEAMKFLLTHTLPPVGKFELHEVRILKNTENYQEARLYERRAERESEFTSTDATYAALPAYKKRNKRKRILSSSDSDVSQSAPPPVIHVNKLFSYSPLKQQNVVNRNIAPVLFPSTSWTSDDSSNDDFQSYVKRRMHRFDNQMTHLKETLSLMDDRIIRIEATLNNIWSSLSAALPVASTSASLKEDHIYEAIRSVFPLADREGLNNFQQQLKSTQYLERTTRILSKIHRGRTVAECVRKVCGFVFGEKVSGEVNWLGINDKARLMGTPLCEAIVCAVRDEQNYPLELESNIHHFIKRWFQGAKDRNGGRTARRVIRDTILQIAPASGSSKKTVDLDE